MKKTTNQLYSLGAINKDTGNYVFPKIADKKDEDMMIRIEDTLGRLIEEMIDLKKIQADNKKSRATKKSDN